MNNALEWAHTRAEWDQAWTHSRHLESMRSQYLGFYFTAVLGVLAVAGPRLSVDTSRPLVVVAALASVLQLLSAASYLVIRRLNAVYHWYQQIVITIRDQTLASPPAAVDLTAFRRPPAWGRARRWTSTSDVTEHVPLAGVYGFAVVLAGAAVRAATLSQASLTATIFCSFAAAGGLALAGLVTWVPRHQA